MRSLSITALIFGFGLSTTQAGYVRRNSKIVLTNDDGWATAVLRATNDALKSSAYNVILSAPADNQSGTGNKTAPPVPRTDPCEFDTCPAGSPAEGFNASDPRLNWVNSFPVDSVRFGIQTLAPKFFGSKPDFVVSGPNDGTNLGTGITGSGTVGAACEAALEGIPSTAFSAASAPQISYTTLDNTTAPTTIISRTYAALTLKYVNTFLALPGAILPPGISVNVNFSPVAPPTNCSAPEDFSFIFTRLNASTTDEDVFHCGTNHLPDEISVILTPGCFVTISAINATIKRDVDAGIQAHVLNRLRPIVSCLPSTA
ncbi:survival protein sure-like phosphatase/nucleotidase [Infundibulicybe gibba]|nr:survival protein sure-like phosphatase/nucleotidase [Infundibulicybe gibba]